MRVLALLFVAAVGKHAPRKFMKHLKYLVVVLALLLSVFLVGCGDGPTPGPNKPSKTVDELKTEVFNLINK